MPLVLPIVGVAVSIGAILLGLRGGVNALLH